MNAQEAIPIRQCLEDLGHPQGPTPINTDNATAHGIVNNTMKQKRSKAMDMRFYWMRDRIGQNQFKVQWRPGKNNLADYHTKHHTGQHHQTVRPIYLYDPKQSPTSVQGCIKILTKQPRALQARSKKRVTWDPHMPKRYGQRCAPKVFPSTKTIHSPGISGSKNILKLNKLHKRMKLRPILASGLRSFYCR